MSQGLKGVVAAETALSMVDGERGELIIAGYAVEELAPNAMFEQTVSLLGVSPVGDRTLPRIVYEVMRVSDAVTGNDGLELGFAALVLVYLGLGGAVAWLLRRLAAQPPEREVARR